ncbi:MAG TPA: YbhB/YbcL family Raf kinase inhibitor-like protein [Acidimicrobiales bacterium]
MSSPAAPNPYDLLPPVAPFTLTSTDLVDGERLPLEQAFDDLGVGGANRSPQLAWHGHPPETQGFTVTCFDPDAPTASGFWHWVLVDVPGSVTELPAGAGSADGSLLAPGAFHVRNDFGQRAYGGAAPPPGSAPHRYIFAVHALDIPTLGVDADASPALVGFNLSFHTLGRATLTALFSR